MFVDLQNAWYNTLTSGLGLSRQSFQIMQPSPPLLSTNGDRALWDRYFNIIPPKSLTQNYIQNSGAQFFSNYRTMIGVLRPTVTAKLSDVIGADVESAWQAYRRTQPPIPLNQLPNAFFGWAFLEAPQVASAGASYYSSILLDPIASANVTGALGPYTRDPLNPASPPLSPEWSAGYGVLTQQLAASPSVSFNFDSSTSDSDTSNTWSGGVNVSFFGLFGAGGDASHQSAEQFASSKVTVTASFGHVLNFLAIPGAWYTSSAMGIAYSNHGDPPWNPNPGLVRWDNTLGPNGSLSRFTVSLIVVDTMNVTVTSEAHFSDTERQWAFEASVRGAWPFYVSGEAGGTSSTVDFKDDGTASVTITSAPGVPIVIGANVLPVDTFVGHEIDGRRNFAKILRDRGSSFSGLLEPADA